MDKMLTHNMCSLKSEVLGERGAISPYQLLHDLVKCCYLVLEEGWNLAYPVNGLQWFTGLVLEEGWNLIYPVNGFMDSNLPCLWQTVNQNWICFTSCFMVSSLPCAWQPVSWNQICYVSYPVSWSLVYLVHGNLLAETRSVSYPVNHKYMVL